MEHPFKLLKQYLKDKSDEELKELYLEEIDKTNKWKGLSVDVFTWISQDEHRGEWAILNEIAQRWIVGKG